ncbi:serine protein kinase RIO [Candidatus Woesearchaeota archaeon]|nr:MAG: serine protein kinase RIO [Candidatus Woesearchaeota archaeon]
MVVRKSREEWKIRANVFDKFTEETLHKLSSQGLFGDLVSAVALGKEANIFTATRGRHTPGHVIVKIYRLENCNFKRMYDYLREDVRYMKTKPQRRAVVFAWAQREYRNLLLAREAVAVPAPLGFRNNVLVMSLIGDERTGVVARQLKDVEIEQPEAYKEKVLSAVRALWQKGLVHGDLSAFNILDKGGEPVFIDFSQAMPRTSPHAKEYLERDLKNIGAYFSRYGVAGDVAEELDRILRASPRAV